MKGEDVDGPTGEPITERGRESADLRIKRYSVAEKILGVVAAALALSTAGLGLFAADQGKKADIAGNQTAQLQQQVQALQSSNAVLKQDVDNDQKTIASLEASSGGPTTGAPSTVYHRGDLDLVPGQSADLDAPASDAQWGTTSNKITQPDLFFSNIYAGAPELGFWNAGGGVSNNGPTTYDACHQASGYSSELISLTKLARDKTVCVQTDQGRTSAIEVRSVSDTKLSFYVTTYAKSGD